MSGKRVSDMNDAELRAMAGQAAGVVKIRLSGAPANVAALEEVFARLARGLDAGPYGVEVLEHSAPYTNRRDPGERVYLTVRLAKEVRSEH